MTEIKIVFASDENFVQHLACAIVSILKHAAETDEFCFFVLDGGISSESKEKLELLKEIRPFQLRWLTVDLSTFQEHPRPENLTVSIFARLFLPEILPDVSRLLYLDCDMVVRESLAELWKTDLQGASIGACLDVSEMFSVSSPKNLQNRLKLKKRGFNTGLLLMDLEKLRENHTFQQAAEWLQARPKQVLSDQDGLNAVLNDDYFSLPVCWNVQTPSFYLRDLVPLIRDEFRNAYTKTPKIFHFIGKEKPWHPLYGDPIGRFYWEALRETPWKDFRLPKPTFRQRIRAFKKKNFFFVWLRRNLQWLKAQFRAQTHD